MIPALHDPEQCTIMGTNRTITGAGWKALARMLGVDAIARPPSAPPADFSHSGNYIVSAIASLYKGGRYIEAFLRNITQQTWFPIVAS